MSTWFIVSCFPSSSHFLPVFARVVQRTSQKAFPSRGIERLFRTRSHHETIISRPARQRLMEQSRLWLMLYCNRETASGFSSAPDMYIARGGLAGLRGPSNLFSSWEIYFTAYCSVFRVKCYRCTHVHPTWPFLFAAPTRDSGDPSFRCWCKENDGAQGTPGYFDKTKHGRISQRSARREVLVIPEN